MDTQLTTAPPNGAAPASSAPRRRRRWIAIALLVVLAGFGSYAGAFLSNYQPLVGDGGASRAPSGARDLGNFFSPQAGNFEVYEVQLVKRDTFSFGFSLWNNGPIGVTVTRVGAVGLEGEPFVVESVAMATSEFSNELVPFKPFSLPPRTYREVVLTVRFTACVDSNSLMAFGQEPVAFHVLGVSRQTTAYFPYTIQVVAPPGTTCH